MNINDTLDGLITTANADQVTLDALLAHLRSTTLQSDDPELYPAPEYDEETGVWTLSQDTANEDSVYKGVYRLPLAATNSRLKAVTLVSPIDPDDITAQLRDPVSETDPNPSFGTAQPIAALEDQCFNAITLLSVGAFEIKLRLSACGEYCQEIDFTATNGSDMGFHINGGSWEEGVGWKGEFGDGNNQSDVYGYWLFPTPLNVTSIELTYTKTAGSGASNVNRLNALYPSATSYGATLFLQEGTNTLGSNLTKSLTVNDELAGIGFDINSGNSSTIVSVSKLRVNYTGEQAFTTDNC